MTRSGTTSILPHISPPPPLILQSNHLSPNGSEIPITLGYSGNPPRMDHSNTTQTCEGICIWHAQVHTWWYVHALCGFVFACVCTKWVGSEQGGPRKWKTGIVEGQATHLFWASTARSNTTRGGKQRRTCLDMWCPLRSGFTQVSASWSVLCNNIVTWIHCIETSLNRANCCYSATERTYR